MKLSKGFITTALIVVGLLVVAYCLWSARESFDPVCSWKKPQSVLISLDILESAGEYIDTQSAKKGCAATPECTGILSTTAGSTTTYKLTRTQPTVSNTNASMQFIEKGMCKKGTEEPTTGLRGLSDVNTLTEVVPSMSAETNEAADAARLPDATPPSMPLNTPLSGVVAIPAVGPPPMPAMSTLGSTVGQSGMLGTNPPGPTM
jgi:hypothetical protein